MKAPDINTFKKLLKNHEMKATPQRIAVHEAMMHFGHASADMISEFIKENSDTEITVASVYNTLSQMAQIGIYEYRTSSNNKMYFDINTKKHIHLYDSRNHEFKDIDDEELVSMVESHFKGRRFRGYSLDAIEIQLICHPTRSKKSLGK